MRHILVLLTLLAGLAFPAAASAVVRGANVPAGDAPLAVALLAGASSSAEDWQRVFCGGSLLDARTVLTAAHCAARVADGGAEVLAGRTNLLDAGGQRVRVLSVAIHPGFDAATFRDDVALLRLAAPVGAATVTVTLGSDPAPGTSATVLGWGALAEGQRTQTAWLQAGAVPVLDDASCAAALAPGFDPATQLCAGTPGVSADACQGDSGGPLVVGSVQVGVISNGRGCGRSPGIYTRLAAPGIASWLASATTPSRSVVASSGVRAARRQHPVVQDVRRLGPQRFQISGYVTNATRATRVHVQRRVGHHWVMVRRAAKLAEGGRFRVVVDAPRWPRLRVMVVGSGGSRPAARR